MRTCPDFVFREAHNGLNLFLTEYPYMDEAQQEKIRKLIAHFSEPQICRNRVQRPALFCKAGSDGALLITPQFVRKVEADIVQTPST
jgi:hypothetical protein